MNVLQKSYGDTSINTLPKISGHGGGSPQARRFGVEVFSTRSTQDGNARIEEHRVGCNGCSMVGSYGYTNKGFTLITDFEEWYHE